MAVNPKLTRLSVQALLLGLTIALYFKPYYNWDIIPYMALAKSSASVSFEDTYKEILDEGVRHIPRQDWDVLRNRHPELTQDAASLHIVLKYFDIKPLYIWTIRIFNSLGFNLVASTYLPSILSYFLLTMLLFWWLQKILPLGLASCITLVIALSSFMLNSARYSSPDMMTALFSFAGMFLVLEYALIPGLILCSLAIFIRPDALLFFLLMLWIGLESGRIKAWPSVVIGLAVIILSVMAVQPVLLFEFLFTTSDLSPTWSFQEVCLNYIQGLRMGLNSIIQSSVPLFVLLGCVTMYINRIYDKSQEEIWPLLLFGALTIFILRYLLHPVIEDRFLMSIYLLILIGFSKALGRLKYGS